MPALAVVLPLILQLLEMAPGFIASGRKLIDAAEAMWDDVTSEEEPTPEEQAQYAAALDASHAAFQASATREDPTA